MDALRRGYDTMTVATCGNYWVATSLAGIKCIVFIPQTYHTKRVQEMTSGRARESCGFAADSVVGESLFGSGIGNEPYRSEANVSLAAKEDVPKNVQGAYFDALCEFGIQIR